MRGRSLAVGLLITLGALSSSPADAQVRSLSLEEAVRAAADHDPSLATAIADRERRAAEATSALGRLLPRVDFEQAALRTDHAVHAFGTRLLQGRFSEGDLTLPALNDPDAITDHASVLRAEMPLIHVEGWLGARAAREMTRSASASVRHAALQLTASVVRLYHRAALATEAARVATDAAEAARTDAAQVASMLRHGAATELDVLEMEVHVAQSDERAIAARGQESSARAALNHAIGLPMGAVVRLTSTLEEPPQTAPESASLDVDSLSLRHPVVERAEAAERAASIARRAARARFAPVVAAAAELQSHRARLSSGAPHGESYVLGVVLRVNLFRGLQDLAASRAADASWEAAQVDALHAASAVRLEVRRAQVALESARARLEVATRALELATQTLELRRRQLETGLGDIPALVRARTSLFDARLRRLETLHAERLARVDLSVALGGHDLGDMSR